MVEESLAPFGNPGGLTAGDSSCGATFRPLDTSLGLDSIGDEGVKRLRVGLFLFLWSLFSTAFEIAATGSAC